MPFMLGDVVRLKSGGPKMTFSELTKDGYAVCVGFSLVNEPFEFEYEPEALELAGDDDDFDDVDGFYGEDDEEVPADLEFIRHYSPRGEERELSDAELDALVAETEWFRKHGGH